MPAGSRIAYVRFRRSRERPTPAKHPCDFGRPGRPTPAKHPCDFGRPGRDLHQPSTLAISASDFGIRFRNEPSNWQLSWRMYGFALMRADSIDRYWPRKSWPENGASRLVYPAIHSTFHALTRRLDAIANEGGLSAVESLVLSVAAAHPMEGIFAIRHATGLRPSTRLIDTGSGMSAENLGRVFEPYFTTKPLGTGLGLLIVRRIVREHGGELSIESSEGKGLTLTIRLPYIDKRVRMAASSFGVA